MAQIHSETLRHFWEAADESASTLRQIDPIKRKFWLAEVIREVLETQDGKCAIYNKEVQLGFHHVHHKIPFLGLENMNGTIYKLPFHLAIKNEETQ
jgi:hypothetical protein